jgi:antitoxin (DNA-binding transcriptional repressor) of toxin-antitoxin stability system
MEYTGIRELRNNLSRYLRKLKAGHVIAVTDRGQVVAEIRAPDNSPTTARLPQGYARLLAQGVIRPAQEIGDPLGKLSAGKAGAVPPGTVADLIREDRGD